LELEQAPFDLEDIAEEAIDLLKYKAEAKSLKLSLAVDPDVNCWIVGDSTRLRQVLLNLLGNAIKFTDAGEVKLSISFAPSGRREVSFAVSDTGIGIPPDKLPTIFEDFIQADSSITRKYGGTGLGLGICQKIAEQMRGRVVAESTPGKGSTFRFEIPFHPASEGAMSFNTGMHNFHDHRILLSGGEASERLRIRATLTSCGFNCAEVGDSNEMLRVLETAGSNPYSLAILVSPPAAARSIEQGMKTRRAHPNLPVLVLATSFEAVDARSCREAGLVCGIQTAARPELLRLVSRALRGACLAKAVRRDESENCAAE